MFFPDCSTVIRVAPRLLTWAPSLVVGAPNLVAGAPRLVAGAPGLVASAPRLDTGAPWGPQVCCRRSQAYGWRTQVHPKFPPALRGVPKAIKITPLVLL